ncbi:hypothetical protein BB560_007174 [Smittium megazygosporum]|uniref:Ammonium-dependent carbamoyl phosphate synthetase n=1 Tax=Smittium megazygosporum TaxID=133381 RepID=A0A2T9XYB1_9FUNG|nr:hypothetical protein BB560_007174 [Smittium megazygosporum]
MSVKINEKVKNVAGIVSGRTSPNSFTGRVYEPCVAPVQSIGFSSGPRQAKEISNHSPKILTLVLEDGSMYCGYSFGAESKSISGEVVFQTGMTGYPEALTDPSNKGFILVLTFPLIGNYGVPDFTEYDAVLKDKLRYFESENIFIAGLVIGNYSSEYSHYLAKSSLSDWIIKHDIPAMYGVDTRAITKKWNDINISNLAAQVSCTSTHLYKPISGTELKHPSGRTLRIVAVDYGMKNKQLRCLVDLGLEVLVVPWNHNFLEEPIIDGLFLSNGPGNPEAIPSEFTIKRIKQAIDAQKYPIFGICLGHQLLSIASGATVKKMKYGNRGANIPCTDLRTGRCYITSQNHGYAVDADSFPPHLTELFVNANDGTNEGVMYTDLPYFSCQFHPESTPGPQDTEFLFENFVDLIKECSTKSSIKGISLNTIAAAKSSTINPLLLADNKIESGGRIVNGKKIRKVLVLGSGGLSIGQAGEFDYSGSQAIKALKEEGIYTILINPNIATIQTSKELSDKCYFLPVTPYFVRKVIKYERPDGIYCTFGGQTALSIGIELSNEFEKLGVQVLGTSIDTIIKTEDRELFTNALDEINEKCAESKTATTVEDAIEAGKAIGYPVIVRAAYALGGLGSGFAANEQELKKLSIKAFASSPQILVERSMKGWKEIEFEVVRDSFDNCIVVCNMENFDPLGIHTGDSIVVAPSVTLSDSDIQMLRSTAIKVVRHLGVVGECNIQYALNPDSDEYCIIEVNARLSRSSALASKATGYPLAFVAAKLGLGISLNTIKNSVTKVTTACFEPSLDYIVVKIPRWDLNKFQRVKKELSSAMKSVGEVMAIGRTFEESLMEAIRSVDSTFVGFGKNNFISDDPSEIERELTNPTDKRVFAIANAFHIGYTVEKIWELTKIDRWFLCRLRSIIETEKLLMATSASADIPAELLKRSKRIGFSDLGIANLTNRNEVQIRNERFAISLHPFVKQIDTVAAEFPASTNYLYLTYNASTHDVEFNDNGVIVLGSGVYRIGSSVEFDWCAVRAVGTLRENGYKTIMINYNPETVSTDFDEVDRLYFSNLSLERVMDIYELERSSGVIISMGGQAPNNIALALHRLKVNVYGTTPDFIDNAENRYKFSRMLDQLGVDQPAWRELTQLEDAHQFCAEVGFPVLVRPSYVLSGAAMNVVFSPDDLRSYLDQATKVSREYPVVISKFIEDAKEIDVDAVACDGKMLVHFISEHVENAGVHSGDATLVLPPQDLDPITVEKIGKATAAIGKALRVTGPYNIQFIAKDNMIKVIECNVRAARSFPFVSKVTGVDLVEIAVKAMLNLPIPPIEIPNSLGHVAVKIPQFSFGRLLGADPILGVEMASTGEVAAFGKDKYSAYIKALLATGFKLPEKNILISIGSYKEKLEMLPSVQKLVSLGYEIFSTPGTADFFTEYKIPVKFLDSRTSREEDNLHEYLSGNKIDLYINLPSKNSFRRPANFVSEGYKSRRKAIDKGIPLITNVKCAKIFIEALSRYNTDTWKIQKVDYFSSYSTVNLPGLVDIASYLNADKEQDLNNIKQISSYALQGGFTNLVFLSKNNDLLNQVHSPTLPTNYLLTISGTAGDQNLIEKANKASILFIDQNPERNTEIMNFTAISDLFRQWKKSFPVITNAYGTNLASILLLASLYDHHIHVTNVRTIEDLQLIKLSKDKGLNLTCDVSVFSVFPLPKSNLASCTNQAELNKMLIFENLDSVDCFSVGHFDQKLQGLFKKQDCTELAYSLALPLLLDAVSSGKLTMDNLVSKLSTNPSKILGIPVEKDSIIEIYEKRPSNLSLYLSSADPTVTEYISKCFGSVFSSTIHRIMKNGRTFYLDGKVVERDAQYCGSNLFNYANSSFTAKASSINASVPTLDLPTSPVPNNRSRAIDTETSPSMKAFTSKKVSEAERLSYLSPVRTTGHSVQATDSGKKEKPTSDELAEFKAAFTDSVGFSVTPPEYLATNFLSSILARFGGHNPFYNQSVVSVRQLTRNHLYLLFAVASELRSVVQKNGMIPLLRGKVMASIFYEPSSRTSSSFQTAMMRLGGQVFSVDVDRSSVTKGETLSDTIKVFSSYADCIVLRHPERGSARAIANMSDIPVFNAGDGTGEHPTQAMLDAFTIREELGTLNGLVITMVGDLKNGRTVHSLARVLGLYNNITINYVAPTEEMQIPQNIINELNAVSPLLNIKQFKYYELDNQILANTDVLYITRVQKERFSSEEEYNEIMNKSFIITNKTLRNCKRNMIVMHPLPRVNEISTEVDTDPRAAYFRQMRYGMFVRMAILSLVLIREN